MMPRRLLALLVLALLALRPAAAAAAAQGDPSFNLVNRTGQTINEIYVSAVTETNWGADRLGDRVLENGRSFPVRIARSGGCRLDVRVVFANGQAEERRNQDTCAITDMVFGNASTGSAPPAGGTRAPAVGNAPAGQDNPSFNLVNRGRAAIREVYVSSARDSDWGPDRLGRDTLAVGAHLAIRLAQGDCATDVRIIWIDGRAEERRAVDTCRVTNLVFQ